MSFCSELKEELKKLNLWNNNSVIEQEEQIKRLCIREAFIENGIINDPNKQYHLEIIFKNEKKAEQISNMIISLGLNCKIISRGKYKTIYMKDGEQISNFLALMGANTAVLKFEEIRVIKETRNHINRMVNCETSNINKIITASVEQITAIHYLEKHHKIEELPENLKQIAYIRKEHPEASLEQLGKMLEPPIGKSGVYHRLQRIIEYAKEIEMEETE